jgi:hypothetical protein
MNPGYEFAGENLAGGPVYLVSQEEKMVTNQENPQNKSKWWQTALSDLIDESPDIIDSLQGNSTRDGRQTPIIINGGSSPSGGNGGNDKTLMYVLIGFGAIVLIILLMQIMK